MQNWVFHYWQVLYSIKVLKQHRLSDELGICSCFIAETYVMVWWESILIVAHVDYVETFFSKGKK
jgi:hypothetical protein